MKQNSQWLSHVRTWSNSADCTSTPSGSPARLVDLDRSCSRPPRSRSSTGSGSSTRKRHSMMSRGTWPSMASTSSPTATPARAAGDPGATATTRGAGIGQGYGAAAAIPLAWGRWPSTRCSSPPPGVLRRRGDGHQGPGLDGAGLRAARVLLPRDRPQPAGGRPLPRPRRGVRRRHRRGAPGSADHAVGPRLGSRGGGGGPGQRRLRGRRRVPAGHQGAPRGEGAGRQGLPDRLRRPRGPRGGRGHDGRGARAPSTGWRRSTRSTRSPASSSPSPCWPRPPCRTATGRRWPTGPPSASPSCGGPGRSDLCFATTNRQSALGEIAERCDAVVVIGSANSSNTRALERLARESGAARVFRVNGPDELPDDLPASWASPPAPRPPRSSWRR